MSDSIIDILKSVGAIITDDHIVLTSGKHSDVYINKDALYPHTQKTALVGKMFAEHCKDLEIDTVAAPVIGGVILSQWVAYYLSELKGKEVAGVYAEKVANNMGEKQFAFTRGYDKYINGKKVLVVEDLTATGASAKKVADAVRAAGGKIVAVGVMVNRDPDHVNSEMMEAPFFALGDFRVGAWAEKDLPAEIAARPINTTVGHGKQYLQEKGLL
jgi:orotate phosphoribosyltransferase